MGLSKWKKTSYICYRKDIPEIEFEVDLEEYIWDSSSYEKENGMGPDAVHSFDTEHSCRCPYCNSIIRVSGWIREYPIGAYDSEDIDFQVIEDDEE